MTSVQHYPVAELTADERANLRGLRKRKTDLLHEIENIKRELQSVECQLEPLYYVDESSKQTRNLVLSGRKKFNSDPDEGLQYLIARGLLERTPESVAGFLYKGEGLSKSAIGRYLGSNEPFNLQVLDAFVKCHDLTNLFIVDALRNFLWSFTLPGESQKIDRIIEKFAAHFCAQNDGAFPTPDTAYVLAYSCIMLNTLLYNPNVKDKPTLETYASMNKECLAARSVSMETLSSIFDSIAQREFKFPKDDVTRLTEVSFLDGMVREGWLQKQGSGQTFVGPLSWKRRWFILQEGCLYYFENAVDRNPKGIIPLKNVGVRRVEASTRPHMFEIYALSPEDKIKTCKTELTRMGKVIDTRHTNYRMCANSQEDLRGWIEAIGSCTQTVSMSRPKSVH